MTKYSLKIRQHSFDPKVNRLRRVPGMGTVSDSDLARLAALVDECEVSEGTELVRQGAIGRSSYLIVEGWAAVSVSGEPVAVLGPGEHIGEMAMLDNGVRSATVTAKTRMCLLEIGPAAMAAYLNQPDILRTIAIGLSARVRAADAANRVPRSGATSSPDARG
jgi:CRP-like cAMP-binding protein